MLGTLGIENEKSSDKNKIKIHTINGTGKIVLTSRETEYITLCALGCKNHIIGNILTVSDSTVKKTLENIFRKLNAKDRTNAVCISFVYNILNVNVLNNISSKYRLDKEIIFLTLAVNNDNPEHYAKNNL